MAGADGRRPIVVGVDVEEVATLIYSGAFDGLL